MSINISNFFKISILTERPSTKVEGEENYYNCNNDAETIAEAWTNGSNIKGQEEFLVFR